MRVANASGVVFSRCEFAHLGGAALDFTFTTDCVVESSYFHDVSGAGVQIGQFANALSADLDTGNTVRNTVVNKAGAEYSGSAGINVGYTQGTQLLHNDVSNMSYGAISVGWGWSRHACGACTNAKVRDRRLLRVVRLGPRACLLARAPACWRVRLGLCCACAQLLCAVPTHSSHFAPTELAPP